MPTLLAETCEYRRGPVEVWVRHCPLLRTCVVLRREGDSFTASVPVPAREDGVDPDELRAAVRAVAGLGA